MKFEEKDPPRVFSVGSTNMLDCGRIYLAPEEQVTFVGPTGREYDFVAKSWGFYATPSINNRLRNQGFKTALVRNREDRYYVVTVEEEKVDEFKDYLGSHHVICWLDELTVEAIEGALREGDLSNGP